MSSYNNYYKANETLRRHLRETGLDVAILNYLASISENDDSENEGSNA